MCACSRACQLIAHLSFDCFVRHHFPVGHLIFTSHAFCPALKSQHVVLLLYLSSCCIYHHSGCNLKPYSIEVQHA